LGAQPENSEPGTAFPSDPILQIPPSPKPLEKLDHARTPIPKIDANKSPVASESNKTGNLATNAATTKGENRETRSRTHKNSHASDGALERGFIGLAEGEFDFRDTSI